MSFEIGWIPKGWVKGDKLKVNPAMKSNNGPERLGVIYHLPLNFNKKVGLVNIAPDDIGAVSFRYEIAEKVQTWLDWWWSK